MDHYICTGGCKGQSDNSGICQAGDCPKHGQPLEKCDCADHQHHGAFDFEHEHDKSLPEKTQ